MEKTDKQICQLIKLDGKAAQTAASAPGCFVFDEATFSPQRKGNKVDYYATGVDYFEAVSKAIEGATSTVFIAGWQVNFDVELTKGKTLWTCLRTAVDKGATVYVMPWMSPKVGMDTGDFETALAVIQLNAGFDTPRAFVLPAVSQSDQEGALGIAFSHHQKLVVIDNKVAFMGGMDLAYGRRDDGRFLLKADGRTGSELYSTCIPHIHTLSKVEQTKYLTRAELVAACFDNRLGDVAQFFLSAPWKPIAHLQDGVGVVTDKAKDINKQVSDWWSDSDFVPSFVRKAQDKMVDAGQDAASQLSRWAFSQLDESTRKTLAELSELAGAQLDDANKALIAWLNGVSLASLPPDLLTSVAGAIESFVIRVILALQTQVEQPKTGRVNMLWLAGSAGMAAVAGPAGMAVAAAVQARMEHGKPPERKKPYENLVKLGKVLPAGGKCPDPEKQPRMPWQDVHCRIEGPSAYDLSQNFVRRWNGLAKRYEVGDTKAVGALLKKLGVSAPLKVKRIDGNHRPVLTTQTPGNCWVQVLRSAPSKMRMDEAAGAGEGGGTRKAESGCLKAMLKGIRESVHFLYIEGQFFQSDYGRDYGFERTELSGPMSALIELTGSPGYRKYAKQLGIEGVPIKEIHRHLRLSQIDDVARDIKGGGADFVNDLKRVMANQATIASFDAMGPAQEKLLNPIGEAIAKRIEQAVRDDLPYHVYMVLPVHPEGLLDTINIMSQLHLTMQSLVFGTHSLVNRIRRALLAKIYAKERKLEWADAMAKANAVNVTELNKRTKQADWTKYLTLLNLRNWDNLGGRPVTEQIYVHSKLLIVDDRMVVLGSANINDRSQIGDRDSELAVIIHDDNQTHASLDGKNTYSVSTFAHNLRKTLWRKHFGLMGGESPASDLASFVDRPACSETWKAVQDRAEENGRAYQRAFAFLPSLENATSMWPTWIREERRLGGYMPFNERFWRNPEPRDQGFTWDAKRLLKESTPSGVQGFIVALPILWTQGENNDSRLNWTTLAGGPRIGEPSNSGQAATAIAAVQQSNEHHETVTHADADGGWRNV